MIAATRSDDDASVQDAPPAMKIDLLGILLRRKWLVIIGMIVGLGLGTLYYFQATPKYRAMALIHVTSKGTSKVNLSTNTGLGYDDYMSGYHVSNNVLPTHAILIRSPLILGRAIRNHKLESLPSFAGLEDPAGTIAGGLVVTKGGGKEAPSASVLGLTFTGLEPTDAQKVLSAVIDTYQEYLVDTYQNVSQDTVQLITEAKDQLNTQLMDKEQKYRDFRKSAPLMWRSHDGSNVHAVRLQSIEEARSRAIVQRVEALARAEAIGTALKDGKYTRQSLVLMAKRLAKSIMESNALQETDNDWEKEMLPLEIERDSLLAQFGADHPRVKAVNTHIQRLRDFYRGQEEKKKQDAPQADFLQVYLESLQQEANETRHQEASLTALYESEHDLAKRLEVFEVQDATSKDEIDRIKTLFQTVVQRLQEINLVKDSGGYVTTVLSPPMPGQQVEPKLYVALGVGGAAGFLLGFGLAFLVDLADKSFRSADEIRDQLGLPVVAHIPVLDVEKAQRMAKKPEPGVPAIEPNVVTFHNSKSRESEAYRRVRTALYFNTQGQDNRVLQVTSPDPSDGKTTLITNLAVSIAQSGKRVLLVDCDFRRPKLHRIFGVSSDTGIAQAITGEVRIEDGIRQTAQTGLDILPCGPRPNNPAELLSSPRFRELLAVLRSKYDFVLVDTPPLLAVTDPSAVAPCVDGVLVTIRLSKGGRPGAKRAIEQLASVGGRVIGVVVNGVGGVRRYGYGYGGNAYSASNYYYNYSTRYYQYEETYGYGKYGTYYADRDGTRAAAAAQAKTETAGPPQGGPPAANGNGPNGHGPAGTNGNGANGNGANGNGHG